MAKKQSDYLASLLSDDGDTKRPVSDTPVAAAVEGAAPSPAPPASSATARAGLSLLGRESALARVASGEVKQVTQLLLDPARVRIWSGNARNQARLSEDSCRDLIDSIIAEGGQKVPAVVRHLKGDAEHDYELVAGTRRHFAISWLRANAYPDMRLLVQVADLDDEAAFRLADIENRARKDISDIERARNYADAVDRHYGGRAARMAERLNLSKGWLSKMLKAAAIPDMALVAFPNLNELSLNSAYRLATALDENEPRRAAIFIEAGYIAAENRERTAKGEELPSVNAIVHRLLNARNNAQPRGPRPQAVDPFDVRNRKGTVLCSVKSVSRQGVTLHLPTATGSDADSIVEAVRDALKTLEAKGVSLR